MALPAFHLAAAPICFFLSLQAHLHISPLHAHTHHTPMQVRIRLPPSQSSDALLFVIKDESSGTWYDKNGKNYRVALRAGLEVYETGSESETDDEGPALVLTEDQIPDVPQVRGDVDA
jgi:hypothetical protein